MKTTEKKAKTVNPIRIIIGIIILLIGIAMYLFSTIMVGFILYVKVVFSSNILYQYFKTPSYFILIFLISLLLSYISLSKFFYLVKKVILLILGISIIIFLGLLLPYIYIVSTREYITSTNENDCGSTIDNGKIYIPCTLDKPVIYLYPEKISEVNLKISVKGNIIAEYPTLSKENSWNVIAYPDGHLVNQSDNREYNYLFWEATPDKDISYDLSTGFIVKGKDTKDFLQETLPKFGLTPKEYNEFIVYWYPKMQNNKYNLIHFAGKEYTDNAILEIEPVPDSILRVFMVYKSLDDPISIKKQEIIPTERYGFTVVEWGGTEIK